MLACGAPSTTTRVVISAPATRLSPTHNMALAPERIIEVRRVHFLQVSSIDVVAQQFTAHIYIECAIQGGAEDKHGLAADGNTMTKKDGAEYKVVPSAMWYIENQFHLPGAVAEEVRECKVLKSGKDLVLIKRIYATFFCNMNMVDFPVDTQDLSVTVECQCAADGPFPVKIVKAKEVAASIHRAGFMPSAMWALHEKVAVRLTKSTLNVGENSKVYPAFAMRVRVCRKWMYHFFNIAVPIQAFSILALALPICLPQEESANRLSVTLALVITAAAYKFATSSMCPPVACAPPAALNPSTSLVDPPGGSFAASAPAHSLGVVSRHRRPDSARRVHPLRLRGSAAVRRAECCARPSIEGRRHSPAQRRGRLRLDSWAAGGLAAAAALLRVQALQCDATAARGRRQRDSRRSRSDEDANDASAHQESAD